MVVVVVVVMVESSEFINLWWCPGQHGRPSQA